MLERIPQGTRRLLGICLLAAFATLVAIIARFLLDPWLSDKASFMPLFLAVLAAAWAGRLAAGLLTTLLGAVSSLYLLMPPVNALRLESTADWVRLALFVFTSLCISLVCEAMHRARDRAERRGEKIEQKRVEAASSAEALRVSEARFRTLADSVPQLVWTADAQGSIDWFNQRWFEYTGSTLEQMRDWGWTRVHDPETLPEVLRQWQQGISRGEPVSVTFPLRGADGRYRMFLTRAVPLKNEHGQVLQWFGSNTDVSEQHASEERLREEDRRKDEFLATLAHELRNPLAPLRNGLEVLRLRGLVPDLQRTWQMMDRQLGQMSRLLDDLLDLSRVTQGKLELRRSRVDLRELLGEVIETCRPALQAANQQLAVRYAKEEIVLHADPVRLSQVFANLLNNAIKYTPAGGQIGIEVQCGSSEFTVTVRDNGIGIDAAHLPRIFNMFAQTHSARERAQGGLGIGLSLVRNLVGLHGGSVSASSKGLGHGSEFVVRLPLPAVPLTLSAQILPAAEDPGERLRILVADDSADACESMTVLLRMLGHEVIAACDGLAAVEASAAFGPEIVLLDIGMPRMNGLDACRALRAQPRGEAMFIVAVTGWGQEEDRRLSRHAGFDAHITKPVELEVLRELARSFTTRVMSSRVRRGNGSVPAIGSEESKTIDARLSGPRSREAM